MNIIITGTGFAFPDGTGSTSRVIAFSKGILKNGGFVNVICPKPTENHETGDRNIQLKGVYEGIPFEYTCGRRLIASTRFGALFLYLKGLWQSYIAILRIHKNMPVNAIILWYGELPMNFIFYFMVARIIGAFLILEKSEYPFVYSKKTISINMLMMFYEKITLKIIDGVIVISGFLKDYIDKHIGESGKIIEIPIMVDIERFVFDDQKKGPLKNKIIYCGNLDHHSEIINLLKSFKLIANNYPQWSLEIIGQMPDLSTTIHFNQFLKDNVLDGRVIFVGAVSSAKIPEKLIDGDIMVLPRASGIFSSAGFPTKLGEYLSTGKPVIVTTTGNISKYLSDRKNAYLVSPDNVDEFAEALKYVIIHYDEGIEVGQNGREVAIREFDLNIQCKRLLCFIKDLNNTK
jgi:glycosyltransferase involved in cell wall biosynthesis